MKKLSKITLKDTDFMDDNEMKEVKGGLDIYNCASSAATCNSGTTCVVDFGGGTIVTGTCTPVGGSCGCQIV